MPCQHRPADIIEAAMLKNVEDTVVGEIVIDPDETSPYKVRVRASPSGFVAISTQSGDEYCSEEILLESGEVIQLIALLAKAAVILHEKGWTP